MKLNEHSKNELRKEILELLKKVPDGQRVEIPLDVLDELIFLKIRDLDDDIVKFPIWTGDFLRKIDLSKLSFENVHWSPVLYDASYYFDINKLSKFGNNEKNKDIFIVPIIGRDDILKMTDNDVLSLGNLINFSYTNINLNLSNITEMYSVNLEGVFLHYSDLKFTSLYNCNLKDTSSTILDSSMFRDLFVMKGTNFSNCNLTSITLDLNKLYEDFDMEYLALFPNFANTEVKIVFNDINKDSDFNKFLLAIISSGKIDGCYLNGKLIDSTKMNKNKTDKQSLLDEYKTMEKEIFDSTLGSIEEQIKGFGGK